MPIEIERLFAGDEQRLRAIRLRALADAPEAFGTTFAEANALGAADWREQLEQLTTFVATSGNSDVGIARGVCHPDHSDAAYLITMWVAPEFRRQGVGAALIDSVVKWARSEGFRRIVLNVVESNAAALLLYRKNGFAANGNFGALPPPRQHIRECQLEMTLAANRR